MSAVLTITGNVGSEVQLRFTPQGKAVASFSVAVSKRKKVGDAWEDGPTSWYRVSAWESQAELIAETVQKGMKVIVVGDFELREYEVDGQKRLSADLTARTLGVVPKLNVARDKPRQPAEDDPWASQADPPPPF